MTIQPLKKGDLIYITAPAKAIEKEYVMFAKDFFEKEGYKVQIADHCLGEFNYFSGTDEERLKDFQFGIDNDEVKVIICARGGYGCVRIVDRINWRKLLSSPKFVVGFSDITVFHNRLNELRLPSIHGTMPLNFKDNTPEALSTLLSALRKERYRIATEPSKHNQHGRGHGVVTGGNLSVLYSLLGTNDHVPLRDKILFIEDLGEPLYAIDRMLYAFHKSGELQHLQGLIVGSFTDLKDSEKPFGKSVEEIILEHVGHLNFPVAFNFPAGHINDNRALTFGQAADFSVNDKGAILKFN